MQHLFCHCGQRVFFENTLCTACGALLGYEPKRRMMLALDKNESGQCLERGSNASYKLCKNYQDYNVCNWLIPAASSDVYCVACALNELIPPITAPQKRRWWASMEAAKRRLVVTLLKLGLTVKTKQQAADGLGFAFMEDKRMNPKVAEEFVSTGHLEGLITVNLAEADEVKREQTRVEMGEPYRTLLGHFRHESGHYYFERLLRASPMITKFRKLFGDERKDYGAALAAYYAKARSPGWQSGYISDYAQSHPLEDWAESWAHYLHMVDTLETAAGAGIVKDDFAGGDISRWLEDWARVTIELNSLNRSMGLRDAYPFVLSEPALTKIRFVHQVVNPKPLTN